MYYLSVENKHLISLKNEYNLCMKAVQNTRFMYVNLHNVL